MADVVVDEAAVAEVDELETQECDTKAKAKEDKAKAKVCVYVQTYRAQDQ